MEARASASMRAREALIASKSLASMASRLASRASSIDRRHQPAVPKPRRFLSLIPESSARLPSNSLRMAARSLRVPDMARFWPSSVQRSMWRPASL